MTSYVINFSVYTLAMIGFIGLAFFIIKKLSFETTMKGKNRLIKVEETLNLNPKKSLSVINVDGEMFLIACDIDTTVCLSKLKDINKKQMIKKEIDNLFVDNSELPVKKANDLQEAYSKLMQIQNLKHNKDTEKSLIYDNFSQEDMYKNSENKKNENIQLNYKNNNRIISENLYADNLESSSNSLFRQLVNKL